MRKDKVREHIQKKHGGQESKLLPAPIYMREKQSLVLMDEKRRRDKYDSSVLAIKLSERERYAHTNAIWIQSF